VRQHVSRKSSPLASRGAGGTHRSSATAASYQTPITLRRSEIAFPPGFVHFRVVAASLRCATGALFLFFAFARDHRTVDRAPEQMTIAKRSILRRLAAHGSDTAVDPNAPILARRLRAAQEPALDGGKTMPQTIGA
jgi:hypothetical protein